MTAHPILGAILLASSIGIIEISATRTPLSVLDVSWVAVGVLGIVIGGLLWARRADAPPVWSYWTWMLASFAYGFTAITSGITAGTARDLWEWASSGFAATGMVSAVMFAWVILDERVRRRE